MIDAAAWVDVPPPPWETGLLSLQEMTQEVAAFSQPPLGSCEQQYQGADAWKCLWSSYRMPLIKTPVSSLLPPEPLTTASLCALLFRPVRPPVLLCTF